MEKDSVGNPSSKQALSRDSWLGMGGSIQVGRKEVQTFGSVQKAGSEAGSE
jgi:hypothetical protein